MGNLFWSALVVPKWWVEIASKVLVHERDRFLSSPSDGTGLFGIGQIGGTGMMFVGFRGTPRKLCWSSEASSIYWFLALGPPEATLNVQRVGWRGEAGATSAATNE